VDDEVVVVVVMMMTSVFQCFLVFDADDDMISVLLYVM